MGTGAGLLAVPLLALLLAAQGLGIGLIVAALTAKYRDLSFLVAFGLQLMLYASPVVFPMARLEAGTALHTVLALNPLSAVIEAFRAALLGFPIEWAGLAYSALFAVGAMATGTLLFHRVERSFADVA
jgi:lipopolysaccharide transport system permease protein